MAKPTQTPPPELPDYPIEGRPQIVGEDVAKTFPRIGDRPPSAEGDRLPRLGEAPPDKKR
jgi:hypothetical protein